MPGQRAVNFCRTKSYRMYKELADEFAEACRKTGEKQSTVIQRLMRGYIEQSK